MKTTLNTILDNAKKTVAVVGLGVAAMLPMQEAKGQTVLSANHASAFSNPTEAVVVDNLATGAKARVYTSPDSTNTIITDDVFGAFTSSQPSMYNAGSIVSLSDNLTGASRGSTTNNNSIIELYTDGTLVRSDKASNISQQLSLGTTQYGALSSAFQYNGVDVVGLLNETNGNVDLRRVSDLASLGNLTNVKIGSLASANIRGLEIISTVSNATSASQLNYIVGTHVGTSQDAGFDYISGASNSIVGSFDTASNDKTNTGFSFNPSANKLEVSLINGSGGLVAEYNFNPSSVPEPSTYALIGGGAALALAAYTRRRKNERRE